MNNGPLSTIFLIAIICNAALMIHRSCVDPPTPRREIVDPGPGGHGAGGATAPDRPRRGSA
jgi:hypothetical protein